MYVKIEVHSLQEKYISEVRPEFFAVVRFINLSLRLTRVPTQLKMTGLHSLAVELLQEIISLVCERHPNAQMLTHQEARALCIMRSVCQFTNAVAAPMLFRHLVMHIMSGHRESRPRRQLRDLAEGSSNASTHAKALSIRFYGWDNAGCVDSYMADIIPAVGSLLNVTCVK
jgi:hypothetical protein